MVRRRTNLAIYCRNSEQSAACSDLVTFNGYLARGGGDGDKIIAIVLSLS